MTSIQPQDTETLQLLQETIAQLAARKSSHSPRVITPANVYQVGRRENLPILTRLMDHLLLPGSRVEGLEHLDTCLALLDQGHRLIFLLEHKGNFDVPAFYTLLGREDPKYQRILDRLIYIAGRKLNEESDVVRMFTEVFSRIVIVPRRELVRPQPEGANAARRVQEMDETTAVRINRAAFRHMFRLIHEGYIIGLFPLGGRPKKGLDNEPVKETTTYLKHFDEAVFIGMAGNILPVGDGPMEEERPVRDVVVFRVDAPVSCSRFLRESRIQYEAARTEGRIPPEMDYEQFTVQRVLDRLADLSRESPAP